MGRYRHPTPRRSQSTNAGGCEAAQGMVRATQAIERRPPADSPALRKVGIQVTRSKGRTRNGARLIRMPVELIAAIKAQKTGVYLRPLRPLRPPQPRLMLSSWTHWTHSDATEQTFSNRSHEFAFDGDPFGTEGE